MARIRARSVPVLGGWRCAGVSIMSDSEASNPCISCGACCSHFRVSFYWGEGDDAPGGHVPAAMTVKLTPWLRAMAGTDPPQRCVALEGEIGRRVGCSIYPLRPSPCRDFPAWQEDGNPHPACTRARASRGLMPLPAIRANATDEERRVG